MAEYANVETFVTRISAWAPGIESPSEWNEWALGRRSITAEAKAPEIAYTDPAFRRRLSLISKMTVQVIHDLLPVKENTKMLFCSFRGELSREYQLNKMLMEEGALSPAAFSLSGFNTPVALASIAFGLKGGYSALYPAGNSFLACVKAANAALFSGKTEELVLIYADESIPPECGIYFRERPLPAAFALLLSGNPHPPSIPISSLKIDEDTPLAFLKQLLLRGKL